MSYPEIEDHGIIGDMHTAALVALDGSVDWLCFPNFDSPSVFAALLDQKKGGKFQIAPAVPSDSKQLYWPDTNVLITRFRSESAMAEVADFMPVEDLSHWHGQHQLVRRVKVLRGSMPLRLECTPAFNYARDKHQTRLEKGGVSFHSPSLSVALATIVDLKPKGTGVTAEFILQENQAASFLFQQVPRDSGCGHPLSDEQAESLFQNAVKFWTAWIAQCGYNGRWRELVRRSALVLKLLIFRPSGAVVAAPTCSLPERVGGARNWDYRYTWIRDAAFTMYALMRIGFVEEAGRFMEWLEDRCHELGPDGSLQTVYRIDGGHDLPEQILDHLEGYRGSRPVRIGNEASQQHQLDIYGELLDSIYLYNKYGSPITSELWGDVRKLLDWVCHHWQDKDHGIWEVRGDRQHFIYSKLMCWVALDRGLRLAEKRSLPGDREAWLKNRDAIFEKILGRGWNAKRRAFSQFYGSDSLDAACLIMPLVFFLSPTDSKFLATLDAIMQPPEKGGLSSSGLVYRYSAQAHVDGLEGNEGTFNLCTFWLVEALTRAARSDPAKLDAARLIFERMASHTNHLGLLGEETGIAGRAVGNFPQALSHLALISAAVNLDRALNAKSLDWPGLSAPGLREDE